MTNRDRFKLGGCSPVLIQKAEAVLALMEEITHPMCITDGFRTAGRQAVLYGMGRLTPGPDVSPERPLGRTVTNADGIHVLSHHQSGRAFDATFLVDGRPTWDEALWRQFGLLYGEAGESVGLLWGGRWKNTRTGKPAPDLPHMELPPLSPGTLVA